MKKLLFLLVFVSATMFAQDKTLHFKFENAAFPNGTAVNNHGIDVSLQQALTSYGADLTSIQGRQTLNAVQFPATNTNNYLKAVIPVDMFTGVTAGTTRNELYPASFSIWVKRTGEIPTGATRTLAMMGNGYNDGFGIQINGNGNIAGKYRSYNLSTTALATDILPLDTWINIVFIADPTNSNFEIYVNGTIKETTSASSIPVDTRKFDVLYVGCQTDGASSRRMFAINLAIDEVFIINRVLTSAEISGVSTSSPNYSISKSQFIRVKDGSLYFAEDVNKTQVKVFSVSGKELSINDVQRNTLYLVRFSVLGKTITEKVFVN